MSTASFLFAASPVLVLMSAAVGLILLESIYKTPQASFPKFLLALAGPLLSGICATWIAYEGLPNELLWDAPETPLWLREFYRAYRWDVLTQRSFLVLSFFLLISVVFIEGFLKDLREKSEIFALLLFAGAGMFVLVSAGNLLMLFMGLELLSLPTYVLVGMRKNDLKSSEAALKYFLYGSFATVLLVLGIALLYGKCGTLNLQAIAALIKTNFTGVSGNSSIELPILSAFILLLVAIGFKVGLAPYHLWLPDAYQGAPTPITGFMGSAIKLAAFTLAIRVFAQTLLPLTQSTQAVMQGLAVLTLFWGNLAALRQTDLKRMFAYSSIGHAGFLFLGLSALGLEASDPQLDLQYYLMVYGLMFVGIFGIFSWIEHHKKAIDLDSVNGLGFQRPLMGLCFLIFLLSSAGIPPTAGFFAKYLLLVRMFASGKLILVALAILSSLLGVAYYLRVIAHLYMKAPVSPEITLPKPPISAVMGIVLCALALIYLAIVPSTF